MFDPVSEPFFRLDIASLAHPVSVLSFTGTEAISKPFVFELEVVCKCPDLDVRSLMYRSAWLSFAGTRIGIHGQIHAVCLSHRRSSAGHYRFSLGPRLACLAHRCNQRIFQGLTAPQIIARVLKEHGIHADNHRFELNGTYAERIYCAQQDESDLELVQRLCGEEGIHYHFQHSRLRHILVFSDSQGGFHRGPSCFYDTAPQRLESGAAKPSRHRVTHFTVNTSAGQEQSKRALERAEGSSTSPYLSAGLLLPLTEHPHVPWNHLWLLTEVQHLGNQVPILDQLFAADSSALPYQNFFRATPWEIGFRPALPAPRPRMFGVQLARVMGPVVGQVYCDPSGRISVQFDWEQQGHGARYASCWVPVSSVLAGLNHEHCLPRVGTNVVVSFIQGDPDQPMVTARLESNPAAQEVQSGDAERPRGGETLPSLDFRLCPGTFIGGELKVEMSPVGLLTFERNTHLAFRVGGSFVQINADHLNLHSVQITFDTQATPETNHGTVSFNAPHEQTFSANEQLLALLREGHPLVLLCGLPAGGSFAHCQQQPCNCRLKAGFDGRDT